MSVNITKWELSDIPDEQIKDGGEKSAFKNFTQEGPVTVKIIEAMRYGPDEVLANKRNTYTVTMECIEGGQDAGARARLTYWLMEKDTDKYSSKTLGVLTGLGKSILGKDFPDKSVPHPNDITGAVVMADINLSKPDSLGRTFTRVFKWSPASYDFSAFSEIDQIYREVADDAGGQA